MAKNVRGLLRKLSPFGIANPVKMKAKECVNLNIISEILITSLYETERDLRKKKEMELAKTQMQYQMAMSEVNRLKSQIEVTTNFSCSNQIQIVCLI